MKERTLQMLRYLTLPCLFSCLSLVADEQEDTNCKQKSDKKPMMTFSQTYDMLKTKDVTPYAGPAVDGGVDASISASYILWHVSEEQLDFAEYGLVDPSIAAQDNVLPQGKLVVPQFSTSSGFKVGLGMDFAYDGWDLDLNYTWLHTHATAFVENDGDSDDSDDIGSVGILVGTNDANFTVVDIKGSRYSDEDGHYTPSLDSAASSWRLHFNVLDLELGRNFFISPKLLMRPHYGLKGTWQKQKNYLTYVTSGSTDTVVVPSGTVVTVNGAKVTGTGQTLVLDDARETFNQNLQQYYWGFGPRAGLNLSWLVSRNFSFFTDAAVSLLWGQFKTTRLDSSALTDITTNAVVFDDYISENQRFRYHGVNGVIEMQLGMRYDAWFSNDEYRFRVEAGWENQYWFDQNQFLQDDQSQGDLSFQGFTLTFRFDF